MTLTPIRVLSHQAQRLTCTKNVVGSLLFNLVMPTLFCKDINATSWVLTIRMSRQRFCDAPPKSR